MGIGLPPVRGELTLPVTRSARSYTHSAPLSSPHTSKHDPGRGEEVWVRSDKIMELLIKFCFVLLGVFVLSLGKFVLLILLFC